MKFETKTYKLKSGKIIKIRVPEIVEAQNLIDLKRSYIENTTTIPMILEEYSGDLKSEMALIVEYSKSANSLLLIAEFENEFIGNIDLTGSKRSKMFHTGMIGMGIQESWRNQGLGKLLVESILDWAKRESEIELVWLDVYASNDLGCALYRNTGFEISGIIKGFFNEQGGYIDKIQMYQRIK